jgi:hypothetical protein
MRKFVPKATEKSMWGRRIQRPGGAWVLQTARVITQPLLVMDEQDKPPKAVRDAAGNSLQGDVLIWTEDIDEDGEIVPVVLMTSNVSRAWEGPGS